VQAEVRADATLDCRGLLCPMPIVKLSKKVKEMAPGQVLELLADDEGAAADVPAWCAKTGNEFLGREDGEGFRRYYVKRQAQG